MRKTWGIVAVLLLFIICAWVARIGFESPRRPNVTITFLGSTNDATGSRLARFAISNLEISAVEWSAPVIEIQTPTGAVGHTVQGSTVLGAGASATITIPLSPNQPAWRMRLRVYPDVGSYRDMKRFVTYTLLGVGLRPRYQTMPYGIDGDWIEAGK